MKKNKNILFLGFHLPNNVYEQILYSDTFPQVQTKRFINSFSKVLLDNDLFNVDFISSRPISNYPLNKQIFVKYSKHLSHSNHRIFELPFINFHLLKLVSRLFSSLFLLFKFSSTKKYDYLFVYSVHFPFLISGLIVAKLFGLELVSLWTDPPAKTSSSNPIVNFFRKIEFYFSKKIMSHFDKSIVLSKHLAIDFNPNKPYLVMEGILDEELRLSNRKRNSCSRLPLSNPVVISYTGTLSKDYGIRELITAVGMFEEGSVRLDLYGSGPMLEELQRLKPVNVNVHGFIDPNYIFDILQNSDFLINCRSPVEDFTKYSFPSKIIEYLFSGTPVIMTHLQGIPDSYRNFVISLDSNHPNDIHVALKECIINYKPCLDLAQNARRFVLSKSYKSWTNTLNEFIMK